MTTELIVGFEVDGYHRWPNAPKQYEEFGQRHRHIFKFICWYPTGNSGDPARRDKELWELRQEARQMVIAGYGIGIENSDPVEFEDMSCEGIADWLKMKMGFSKVFCAEEYWLGAIVS